MDYDHIEAKLHDFIDTKVLNGQGADLTSSTPLFEYGILDSFTLFGVINFIADEFKVTLSLERLRTEDFQSISTIAGVVRSTLAASSSMGV